MRCDGLPSGFEIIGPANFAKYQEWYGKALADPTVRRYLSNVGWVSPLKEAPADEWARIVIVSDKTLLDVALDRSAVMEICVGLWTLGEQKEIASGRALLALLWVLRRHRYFRRVRSGCMVSNGSSLRLHKHIYGEPWGVEPNGAWDEVAGYQDIAHFAAPVSEILRRFDDKEASD